MEDDQKSFVINSKIIIFIRIFIYFFFLAINRSPSPNRGKIEVRVGLGFSSESTRINYILIFGARKARCCIKSSVTPQHAEGIMRLIKKLRNGFLSIAYKRNSNDKIELQCRRN